MVGLFYHFLLFYAGLQEFNKADLTIDGARILSIRGDAK
jgi:hypothetical protein